MSNEYLPAGRSNPYGVSVPEEELSDINSFWDRAKATLIAPMTYVDFERNMLRLMMGVSVTILGLTLLIAFVEANRESLPATATDAFEVLVRASLAVLGTIVLGMLPFLVGAALSSLFRGAVSGLIVLGCAAWIVVVLALTPVIFTATAILVTVDHCFFGGETFDEQ